MSNIDLSLLPDFIVEAEEHLEEMEAMLLRLVQQPDDLEVLNDIFRPIHTIKGGAQYIGLEKISQLSHRLEDLLDLLRAGRMVSNAQIVETLISAADRIKLLVSELEATQTEQSDVEELVDRLALWIDGESDGGDQDEGNTSTVQRVDPPPVSDTVSSPYESDEDRELYEIFELHLTENYADLASLLSQLTTADGDAATLLEKAIGVVESMRSSANYMDYVELVHRYKIWLSDLDAALSRARAGDALELESLVANVLELRELFPVLNGIDISTSSATTIPQQGQESTDISDSVAQAFAELAGMGGEEKSSPEPEYSPAVSSPSDVDLSLLPDFVIEADEHLAEMESMLLQLMQQPDDLNLLNDIFRPIHTIKGGAQYIGLDKISQLAHRLEDLLDLLRSGKMESSFEIIETLISARDRINTLNEELKRSQHEQSDIQDLIDELQAILSGDDGESSADVAPQLDNANAARGDVSPAVTVSQALYQEEDDKELFEIFIAHMQEQYNEIVSQLQDMAAGADKVEILSQCMAIVEKMTSSANYMDYVELVQRYRIWLNEIEKAGDELRMGIDTSLAFMQHNLDELAVLFPQMRSGQAPELGADEVTIKVVVNEPVEGGLEDTLAKMASGDRAAAVQKSAAFDEQLFNSLAGALESSMPRGTKDEFDTLNQIFDELVSGDKGDKAKAVEQPEAIKKPQKREKAAAATEAKKKESAEAKIRKSVRVDADKIDTLMNQVGELVVDRSYFYQLITEMRNLQRHLKDTLGLEQKEVKMLRTFTYRLGEAIASLGRTSNDLQEGVMKMRMLPISQIFNRYPRLVHDLTRNIEKSVNLVVKGEDTELDRMIVEELSDPLIHIIRNAVDHGLETESERREKGKSAEGTLVLEAYQESNHIVIEVTDDGKGIDPVRVRQKAIDKGLFSAEEMERFSNDEIIGLIMTAGFSTADKITGTSGRGVGMDVVKKNIEKLNGTLEIDSKVGVGTQMRLKIPLTLAIIHALMVRVGGELFTIPLANVDETVRIFKDETSTVEGVEVIHLRGQTLPIFRLSTLFGQSSYKQGDKSFVVIVSVGGTRTGFVVDELLGQEEVVIKPLADYVQDKSGFSGATIIGDGRISLILDVYEMVRMTANKQAKKQREQTQLLKSKIRRKGLSKPAAAIDEGRQ
ncbi:MAG: Hpt domain-containing protein [Chromatiales bacterium]|nr:Hpt domain-containing protein [Chromatiales bacterium]